MQEKWLIRLFNAENNDLIAAYYSENPEAQLKTFYFCQNHNIHIYIPDELDNENYKYHNKECGSMFGSIYDIEVYFGNKDTYCSIDIWLEDII